MIVMIDRQIFRYAMVEYKVHNRFYPLIAMIKLMLQCKWAAPGRYHWLLIYG